MLGSVSDFQIPPKPRQHLQIQLKVSSLSVRVQQLTFFVLRTGTELVWQDSVSRCVCDIWTSPKEINAFHQLTVVVRHTAFRMGYKVDILGILIGLSCGEVLNLIQGYVSGMTGFSRLQVTLMTLTLFASLIFYMISTHKEEPAREKQQN